MLEIIASIAISVLLLAYGLLAVHLMLCGFGWVRRRLRSKRAARRQAWQAPEAAPVSKAVEILPPVDKPMKPRCRYGECVTLYLNGELTSKRQRWFDAHCATCLSCWERFVQEKRLRAPDVRCAWEGDIRPYMNHKLLPVDREWFKGHLIICEHCQAEVEKEEERLESWLEEWEPIAKLKYRPRSHGESSS